MADPEGAVRLSSTLRMLRAELSQAIQAASGEELQFRLGPVELELQAAVTNEGGGEAGIKFWVIALGAKGSRSREQMQTVKLTLTPHLASKPDEDVNVGARGQLGE